jgi:hypothetical protein
VGCGRMRTPLPFLIPPLAAFKPHRFSRPSLTRCRTLPSRLILFPSSLLNTTLAHDSVL